jgi:hypothetical protein
MIRSNLEIPRVPDGWLDGAPAGMGKTDTVSAPVQIASTLDYDGASRRLTLTRSDGTVQQFPANNNAQRNSRGNWEDGTFQYGYHKSHPEDSSPEGAYGSYGIHVFQVPGAEGIGVHSGRENTPDQLGRPGVDHATRGCIRTTDEGVAAINDAISADDPVTHITIRNNRQE